MAEVDTSVYKNLQPQDPLKQPLAIMQLLGAMNQNKLFQQVYDSRQKVGEAYQQAIDPGTGKIDNIKLRTLLKDSGFGAGEALGQANVNETGQFNLDVGKLKHAQSLISSVASNPKATTRDYSAISPLLSAAGVDPDKIATLMDPIFAAKTPKERSDVALRHGIMALGTEALGGESGTPDDEGRIPTIPKGRAIVERTQPGGMITTNPPGYTEAATISGQQMSAARARGANYGADIFPMNQLLEKIRKLGPNDMGPGTPEFNKMKSFVKSNLSWLPGAEKAYGDPEKIATFQELEKYATQLAGSRANQFGHGTDQSVSLSLTGSPNAHIDQLAGDNLTQAIIGLRKMEHAQLLQAEKLGISPGKFSSWASQWMTGINPQTGRPDKNYRVDPRAFMIDTMTPEQRQNVEKSFKTQEDRTRFNNSVHLAVEHGLIDLPK